MGRQQKQKGKRWERAVATRYREAMEGAEDEIKRGWQARTGADASDVVVPRWWPECKHGKAVSWKAAYRQAIADAPADKWPVVHIRDHGNADPSPFVVMSREVFIEWTGEFHLAPQSLFIESSSGVRPDVRATLRRAVRAVPGDFCRFPLALVGVDDMGWFVAMTHGTFFDLIGLWWSAVGTKGGDL